MTLDLHGDLSGPDDFSPSQRTGSVAKHEGIDEGVLRHLKQFTGCLQWPKPRINIETSNPAPGLQCPRSAVYLLHYLNYVTANMLVTVILLSNI